MGTDGRSARGRRTRERILRVARALIERRGAPDVSMEDVASAAEVTRRTLYDHFGSRAGLLVAIAAQADEDIDLERLLGPVLTAPTGIDGVDRLVEMVAEVTPGMLDLATAIERARVDDPGAGAAWDDRMESRLAVFLHLVGRIEAEGRLRDGLTVAEAADVVHAALSWHRWRTLVDDRGWTASQWVQRTKEELRRMLTDQ